MDSRISWIACRQAFVINEGFTNWGWFIMIVASVWGLSRPMIGGVVLANMDVNKRSKRNYISVIRSCFQFERVVDAGL